MLIRTSTQADIHSEAVFSDCEKYRYALTRIWDDDAGGVTFVMLNPSTADEQKNDPTIERCERRARAMGYGAYRIVNLFAWRETSPALLRKAKQPIGPDNDAQLLAACGWADLIVAGWGVHGAHLDRGPELARLLVSKGHSLHALGVTKDGHPRHPLYVAYARQPELWTPDH